MTTRQRARHRAPGARAALGATAVGAALVLAAGCGADEPAGSATPSGSASASASTSASPTASPSAEPTSYLPVPAGVVLTEQGSDLTTGTAATVAWQPRQEVTGVLDVTVTALERTTLKRSFVGWKIPEGTRSATPYFVRASVTNRGESDLAGRAVPLYAVDAAGTLVEATSFASLFGPCRQGDLPEPFAPGTTAEMCLVYFLPEGTELTGVSFRPGEAFNPVTWTGEVIRAKKRGRAAS